MSDAVSGSARELPLSARAAGSAVIKKCLQEQATAVPRGRFARLVGRNPLHPSAVSWYQGAIGELEVAGELSRLGFRWVVLHAIPLGNSGTDIDHIVIGPGGVFSINTKNHAGRRVWAAGRTFMVSGQKQKHVFAAIAEGVRATRLLSRMTGMIVHVTPIIVVVRPGSLTLREPEVPVISCGGLVRWLRDQPLVYSDVVVRELALVASERTTWTSAPVEPREAEATMESFTALRREVAEAARRRQVAGLLCGMACVGIAAALVSELIVPVVRLVTGGG